MSVAVIVYNGLLELELGAALTALNLGGGEGTTRTVSRSRASVVGVGGLVTTPEVMFASLEPPRAVFVPGGPGAARLAKEPLAKTFLASQAARGAWIAASGSGLLALGAAGLLRGRDISAAPDLAEDLWDFGPSAVHTSGVAEDGGVITAPGGLGALDVALRLCVHLWGQDTSVSVAHRLGR